MNEFSPPRTKSEYSKDQLTESGLPVAHEFGLTLLRSMGYLFGISAAFLWMLILFVAFTFRFYYNLEEFMFFGVWAVALTVSAVFCIRKSRIGVVIVSIYALLTFLNMVLLPFSVQENNDAIINADNILYATAHAPLVIVVFFGLRNLYRHWSLLRVA